MRRRKSKFALPVFFNTRRDSHGGHILYLMVHIPFIWWWKVGITGKTATARAQQVDKAVFGFPVPVMILVLPGAFFVEQDLHRHFSALNCKFYSGDGSSEFFWFPVAPVVFALMVSGWLGYIWLFDLCFGTGFFYIMLHFIVDCIV